MASVSASSSAKASPRAGLTPSSKNVCGCCRRTGQSPNNCRSRYAGEYLVFCNASTCMPCRNFHNGPLKGKPVQQIKNELKNQSQFESYLEALECYEAVLERTAGRRINDTDID